MKQVEVTILGQVYMLGCPEGGEALLAAAVAGVDREMTTIREAGKVRGRERIAVLAALNVAYQLAERMAQGPAAALAPAPAPTAGASGRPDDPATPIDLDALLRRVDDALGSDGQLL
ncbi:MAG: cell division protein ZapA [Burkholderiales bacterium]|nr:cell division protein ZapA [Burkholderiales bacterium]MDE2277485.1 cell division protein ZapA [Burkholderiales bacterium]